MHTFIKYPPASGGHERYVQALVEGLRRRRYDARVVTSDLRAHSIQRRRRSPLSGWIRRRDPSYEVLDGPYDLVNGVPVSRLPTRRPPTRRVVIPGMHDALVKLRPQLIHAHDIWRESFEVSIDVARELDVPLFLNPVYHDRTGERHGPKWTRELRRVARKIPATATVFFNTRWEEEQLAALGVRFARTAELPPSIDFDEFDSVPQRPVPGVPADRTIVSFVGRLTPSKGVDLLIRGFAEALARGGEAMARAHLVLAGFRDSDFDYGALAEAEGLGDRVTLLVDLPREQIVNLLRRSAVFALPSRAETFGIVILEAWAADTLVLVSDREALPYVVRHGRTGLVCSDDEWGVALQRAIEGHADPWARELARNGAGVARRHHGRASILDRLVRYIEEERAPAADS